LRAARRHQGGGCGGHAGCPRLDHRAVSGFQRSPGPARTWTTWPPDRRGVDLHPLGQCRNVRTEREGPRIGAASGAQLPINAPPECWRADVEVLEAVNVEILGERAATPDIAVKEGRVADTDPVRYPSTRYCWWWKTSRSAPGHRPCHQIRPLRQGWDRGVLVGDAPRAARRHCADATAQPGAPRPAPGRVTSAHRRQHWAPPRLR